MVAFLAFGDRPNSFVVANGSLLDYQNMPGDYEGRFKIYEWNAMQVQAFSTGPAGFHWMLKVDLSWAARGPSGMVQYLPTELITVGPNFSTKAGRGRVTFVAFAPNGKSWFIRYDSKQCLWGPEIDTFPITWQGLIDELERTHPRKDECIDFVAFGVHDLLLVRFENGNSFMALPNDTTMRERISKGLIKEVEERLAAGWTLGDRTRLCSFDTERWFIEWRKGAAAEFRYSMGVDQAEDLARVHNVLSGVGNDKAAVANAEASQLIAANSGFAQQLALSRIL